MKKYIILISGILLFFGFSFANENSRGLQDVDIISRSQWGADEKFKYWDMAEYQKILKQQEEAKKYLEELHDEDGDENSGSIQNSITQQDIYKKRTDYVNTNFSSEFSLDKTQNYESGNQLWWPFTYKDNKTRIIVHHTANDGTKLKSPDEVKDFLKSIYRYHALKNGRGDIGYNFVIDKWGNIYEGRAGGPGVVGAHAKWNNVSSVGISLIGNFEIEEPSQAQINALIKLATAVSLKYNIMPYNTVTYHKESKSTPYIQDFNNYSLVGHKDAGYTACPGKNLYSRLDSIRQSVNDNIKLAKLASTNSTSLTDLNKNTINLNKTFYSPTLEYTVKANMSIPGTGNISCSSFDNTVNPTCTYDNGTLSINLKYIKPLTSGYKKIIVKAGESYNVVNFGILFQKDLDYILDAKKNQYFVANNISLSPVPIQKITYKVNLDEAKSFISGNIKVLLYDLSTTLNSYEIACTAGCSVILDNNQFDNVKTLIASHDGSSLTISLNSQYYNGNSLKLINTGGEIQFKNYTRVSYAKIPWNSFKGNIYIQKEQVKLLDKGLQTQYAVINDLPFNDYMKGVAESSDDQPLEKVKAMTLLSKNYALFYINKKNDQPSVPKDASYNAIDDARIFQKYVGAGFERTSKKWQQALEETKNLVVMYNGYIPILPYYSCSAGFVLSGKEKFGWTDTPYLSSKLDFDSCSSFNGHGVGLSGKGAEMIANRGFGYSTIIQYYYNGVVISNIGDIITSR